MSPMTTDKIKDAERTDRYDLMGLSSIQGLALSGVFTRTTATTSRAA